MHIALRRSIALVLGTVAGLGIVWGIAGARAGSEPDAMAFHDGRRDLAELKDYLVTGEAQLGASRGPLGHLLLTEPVAERLFNFTSQRMIYDPLCYFRRRPFLNQRMSWDEHPDGYWRARTNSLGLREDGELSRFRPGLRVFVTGDSHTDGVCNNAESFPNRLEAALAAADPERSVEVLNAGVGGYSFYNYLGVFERYREFDMQVFVVAVYGGNDFENVTTPFFTWRGKSRPPWGDTWQRVLAGMELDKSSMAQALMPISYFAQVPWLERPMVKECVDATLELQRRCDEEGVELIVAYLPSAFDAQPSLRPKLWAEMIEVLELDEHELGVTRRQADMYLGALAEGGVRTVDLRPAFGASSESLYWLKDLHLNLAGHQLVADVLLPLVEEAARSAAVDPGK